MVDEQPRRRRRRRRGRRGGGGEGSTAIEPRRPPAQEARARVQAPPLPDWKWLTFPVFVAFAAGIVLMRIVYWGQFSGPAVFLFGVFGLAFSAAHVGVRLWLARRR